MYIVGRVIYWPVRSAFVRGSPQTINRQSHYVDNVKSEANIQKEKSTALLLLLLDWLESLCIAPLFLALAASPAPRPPPLSPESESGGSNGEGGRRRASVLRVSLYVARSPLLFSDRFPIYTGHGGGTIFSKVTIGAQQGANIGYVKIK